MAKSKKTTSKNSSKQNTDTWFNNLKLNGWLVIEV